MSNAIYFDIKKKKSLLRVKTVSLKMNNPDSKFTPLKVNLSFFPLLCWWVLKSSAETRNDTDLQR